MMIFDCVTLYDIGEIIKVIFWKLMCKICKYWVSWKQRPLRPQNLKTKTPHILGGSKIMTSRQCDWKLSIGDKNFEATF